MERLKQVHLLHHGILINFLNPKTDGAVLPILHLNGYKISNPTILARISEKELVSLMYGYGYEAVIVSGDDDMVLHEKWLRLWITVLKK